MNTRKALLFLVVLVFSTTIYGQSEYQFGILPAINLNKGLKQGYKINFKVESRQTFEQGLFEDDNPFEYDYILTDFTTLLAKKVAYNKTVTVGYLFRVRGDQIVHRSIQQYIWTNNLPRFRLSHRIAADQTFNSQSAPEFRLRYRLASQIPFNGETVDPKEFYVKVNNEYLNQFESGSYDLEVRLTPFLGYSITDKKKLEFGLDYRVNSFLDGPASHRFWIALNYYLSL
ncbi:DUF2490 domain-containing protein [Gilvibacter sp.]|uniref:DUF2490 domain-containing protein n=1 Tax=Gilvibacter sp. TaxID=2729997 RepID=UPI0025BE87FC|nr:DUF2490 domain-containing protein [Gilvibacter sp.]NQX77967.1 DUF2490 domain-containing protein [Gilvibacter sp.]